jgi:hypothetical protein
MANKIYMDTELMEQLGSQITQLQHSLSSIQQSLSGSVAEVRRVASGQTGIINKLSAVQKNTQKAAEHTGRLARAVRAAAGNWEEAEKRVASQQLPEAQNTNSNSGAGGDGLIGAARFEDVIRMSLGYPADRSKWSKEMTDKFNKAVKEASIFKTTDGLTAIVTGRAVALAMRRADGTVVMTAMTIVGGGTVTMVSSGAVSVVDGGAVSLQQEHRVLVHHCSQHGLPVRGPMIHQMLHIFGHASSEQEERQLLRC